jgi:WhiB family transcriptional regulator, redox-sensing transcriptional regulator
VNARDRWQWTDNASCRDEDPELFFPPEGDPVNGKPPGPDAKKQQDKAREICAGCPVKSTCLHTAFHDISGPRVEGVWGGALGRERDTALKIVARRRQRAAKKTKTEG